MGNSRSKVLSHGAQLQVDKFPVVRTARDYRNVPPEHAIGMPAKQDNGYDCGVFSMLACLYVALRKRMDFTQRDVTSFYRKYIMLQCVCCMVVPSTGTMPP